MKYDFTTVYDRKGKDAAAVDTLGLIPGHTPSHPKNGFDVISMWLADMNFATVPTIPEAMIERASHPLFGYYQLSPEYFQSIIRWQKERNGVENLTPECIGFENGVLGGVLSALNVLASRGDKVMLHSPTYIGFTFSLINCGYSIVHSPLYLDENNIWRMDFEDMERRIVEEKIHVMIFCSPHNPTGRVWERWDTSNRAINVIINNLKGIFFDDDDFEHMSCSIEASWGKIGMTEIRICDHKELSKIDVFR